MNTAEIEIVPYVDAPWAPRLEGAQYAYRVMLSGNAVMAVATRGDRAAVTKTVTKLAERLKRERRGQPDAWRNFVIKAVA